MGQRNFKHRHHIFQLITQYERLSEKRAVHFANEVPYVQLIDYFEGECLLERALEVAGHAIHQFPYSVEFQVRKAELLLENREPKEALTILDKAEVLSPGFLP
ncbi:MAG: tetratricopeptide repeat protein, partial [Bacteroidota bacterium]